MDPVALKTEVADYPVLEERLLAATANVYLTIDDVEFLFKHIIKKYGLSKRIQSILEILFHKRKEGWKQIFMQGEGPKTIKEIEELHIKNQR